MSSPGERVPLLTLREAGRRLGVSDTTAWRLVQKGDLAAVLVSGRGRRGTYRISEGALLDYERRHRFNPFAPEPVSDARRATELARIDRYRPPRPRPRS